LNQNRGSIFCFDAFSSREPVPTSLENALKSVPALIDRACQAWSIRGGLIGTRPSATVLVSNAFRQQPLQIDEIIRAALRSSCSTAGSPVPSATPLPTPPVPEDESAVPRELVPGAAGDVPAAPPVVDDE
jgi:hypothetical protein